MPHLQGDSSKSGQNAGAHGAYAEHPAWKRLEDQLAWYDNRSIHCQKWYKRLNLARISMALSIPVIICINLIYIKWLIAIAGVLIAILEAIQHMNQYSALWVTYRATAERLKHDKHLFLSSAGPFKNLGEDDKLIFLAERTEEHVSTEHANWIGEMKRAVTTQQKKKIND